MNFTQYIPLAIATEIKDYQVVADRLTKDKDKIRLLHASYLVLEVLELEQAIESKNQNNIIEELGDVAWYLAVIYDAFNMSNSNDFITNKKEDKIYVAYLPDLKQKAFLLADNVKKIIMYDNKMEQIKNVFEVAEEILIILQKMFGNHLNKALKKNIAKLKARYPNKYSDHSANNRDLKNEYNNFKVE